MKTYMLRSKTSAYFSNNATSAAFGRSMTHDRHVGQLPLFTHGQIERVVVCRKVCYWADIIVLSYTQTQQTTENRKSPIRASDHENGLR